MSDFKSRLIEEEDELRTKSKKLAAFIQGEDFKSDNQTEQSMKVIQLSSMLSYLICLETRIKNL